MKKEIYLDEAATSMPKREVREKITRTMTRYWHNPSSVYFQGRRSRGVIDDARETIATEINCEPYEIFFVPSGCFGNTFIRKSVFNEDYLTLIDPTSHSSVISGKNELFLAVDKNGKIDNFDSLMEKHIKNTPVNVSICGANNEIGTIQPIRKITKALHEHNPESILHVDAVQLFPYQEIDVKELGIDCMTVSGHKFGTPAGIGFVYISERLHPQMKEFIYGEQESGYIGGTENTPYIIGLEKAVDMLKRDKKVETVENLRNYFVSKCEENITDCSLVGAPCGMDRLPNNANILFKGIDASALILALSTRSIFVSGGSACNSHSRKPSHVLKAIGIHEEDLHSCVRFTFGEHNTYEEIDYVIEAIKGIRKELL